MVAIPYGDRGSDQRDWGTQLLALQVVRPTPALRTTQTPLRGARLGPVRFKETTGSSRWETFRPTPVRAASNSLIGAKHTSPWTAR